MALTTGGIITSGNAAPMTQSPSAPAGGSGVAGSISQGPAPTMPADVVTPADQVDSVDGIGSTGQIMQGNDGAAQPMNQGVATEPPTVHPDTPYTGTGVVNKQPPTSGGPSQAKPKTGLS